MSSHELEIRMTLKDEISKRLQGIQGAMSKLISVTNEIGDLGHKFVRMGRNLTFLGASITGPFVLALRSAAQYSVPVKKEMENLTAIFTAFQIQIAEAVVPIVQKFTNILGNLYNAFTKLSPETKTAILQTTMMAGVYGTLAGVVLSLTGKIMKLIQQTAALGGIVAAISPFQRVLLIIIASLVLLIGLWDQLKIVAIPVLNLIETALYILAGAVTDVFMILDKAMEWLIRIFQGLFSLLSKIPGPTKQIFESLRQGAKGLADEFKEGFNYQLSLANSGLDKMADIWKSGQGDLAKGMNTASNTIKEVWKALNGSSGLNMDKIKAQLAQMKNEVQNKFNAVKEIVSGTAQAMTQAFGQLFFNVFTGQLINMKQIFADFGRAILKQFSDVLAEMVVRWAIFGESFGGGEKKKGFGRWTGILGSVAGMLSAGGGGGATATISGMGKVPVAPPDYYLSKSASVSATKKHFGGIVRAHSGLAVDEVPIIAQIGEGVLSRRGMSALGRGNFDRLNRGESAGGANREAVNITPILVVKAWDFTDISKHRREIQAIIVEGITSNAQIRKIIREYA